MYSAEKKNLYLQNNFERELWMSSSIPPSPQNLKK